MKKLGCFTMLLIVFFSSCHKGASDHSNQTKEASYLMSEKTLCYCAPEDSLPVPIQQWCESGIAIDHLAYSIHTKGRYNMPDSTHQYDEVLAATRAAELKKFSAALTCSQGLKGDERVLAFYGTQAILERDLLIAAALEAIGDSLPKAAKEPAL